MGIITHIEAQKKSPDRFNVFVDGDYAFPVSVFVLSQYKLKINNELDEKFLEEVVSADVLETLYSKALNFISYRPRTEKEVRDKLRLLATKFSNPFYMALNWDVLFDTTLKKLQDIGLVNDEVYVKQYIDSVSISKQPPSKVKIVNFLRKRGVPKEVIEENLASLDFSSEFELENARKVFLRKISKFSQENGKFNQKDKSKIWRFMASKGYTSDTIKALFDSESQVY